MQPPEIISTASKHLLLAKVTRAGKKGFCVRMAGELSLDAW